MKERFIQLTIFCAFASAMLIANLNCFFLVHQEKEPEEVRKLRKF